MEIRRIVLWAVLGASLLMLWENWQQYNGKPSMFSPVPAQTQASTAGNGAKDSVPAAPAAAANGTVPGGAAPGATAAPAGAKIQVRTDLLAIDIATLGGSLVRAELLTHKDGEDNKKNIVLFDQAARKYEAQSGLIGVEGAPNHRTPYRVVSTEHEMKPGKDTLEVVLEAEGGGLKDRLVYSFQRGSYVIGVRHQVTNTLTQAVTPAVYMQLLRDNSKPEGESFFYSTYTGPAIYTDTSKFEKVDFNEIEKGNADHAKAVAAKEPGWISVLQHYFVTAWIPANETAREIYTEKVDTGLYRVGIKESLGSLAPGATAQAEAKLFVGPQDQDVLEKLAPGLDLVVDYGALTFIAKPIFLLLQWLHGWIGNWGWAIVALTVLIKLAFYPLSAAGYKSMARMKKVTPRMQALKERHKDDRMKMQQAMMELYKVEKINPMGGCLPILVQIPVFIALYWVLQASVEMRGAPWLGWIHDLAAPDPFYILPVIMMASMFVQYKLNPTPPDPLQAKIMLWMPLIFGVMFFAFPAGLVLYWVVNNLLSILQQWRINSQLEKAGLK